MGDRPLGRTVTTVTERPDCFVVCTILSDGSALITEPRDVAHHFRHRVRTAGDGFLPVAAFESEAGLFERVTSLRLPSVLPVSTAGFLFRDVGIADGATLAFARQFTRLGDRAVPLVRQWVAACDG